MVVGVCMVKDEIDVIAATVEHMAYHCDHLLVADNGSTDGTRELLDDLHCDVLDDPEPGYYQSQKVSNLALMAFDEGAEWIVPFDADERWLADGVKLAELLPMLPGEAFICEATVIDHVASPVGLGYRRRETLPLRKVACRARADLTIHQGNHGASYESTPTPLTVTGQLQVRHFPYRSPEQFIKKVRNGAAAYAATDLPEEVGAHWRQYGKLSDEQLRDVFHEWFWSDTPEEDDDLVFDPCPVLSRS